MTKKKSLFLKIGCLILALGIAIIPLFSFRTKDVAKADEVEASYVFRSSDTYYIASMSGGTQQINVLFSGNNSWVNNQVSVNFSCYLNYANNDFSYVDYYLCNFVQQYVSGGANPTLTGNASTYFNINYDTNYTFYLKGQSSDTRSISVYVRAENGYNSNVYSVFLGKSHTSDACPDGNSGKDLLNVVYTCSNGSKLTFSFTVATNFNYNDRTYYLSNALTDDQLYQSGYNQGNTDGYDSGYTQGTSDGYTNGYNAGYGAGTNHGIETASDYSFLSLIGAVVDAPIKAFTGLFNFNILGVNLSSFLFGLFTIAVIIVVVKTVL